MVPRHLRGKVDLITGTSSGIGSETAMQYYARAGPMLTLDHQAALDTGSNSILCKSLSAQILTLLPTYGMCDLFYPRPLWSSRHPRGQRGHSPPHIMMYVDSMRSIISSGSQHSHSHPVATNGGMF